MTRTFRLLLALAAASASPALAANHGPLPAGHDDATYFEEAEPSGSPHVAQRYDDTTMKVDETVAQDAPPAGDSVRAEYDPTTMLPVER